MKVYLVTGGAGFIGSNFVKYLFENEKNIKVVVLDKLTYSGNLDNLKDVWDRDDFKFVKGDICDSKIVDVLVSEADVVVNFAADVAVDRSINDRINFLNTDIYGVYTLLEAVLKQKGRIQRFIQISTDEVYGQIIDGSFDEESHLYPRNPYAASKLGGERLAYSYYSTYDLPVIITRASNNYGPWAYPEKMIPLFITNLISGHDVPVFGNGKHVRDWLFVRDHCSAVHLLINNGKNGEAYNVGGEQEIQNILLTKKIISLLGMSDDRIKHVKDRPGHDLRYSLNCDKIKALGWKPEYDLEQGLLKTVNWYLQNEDYWAPLKEKMDKRYITGYWNDNKAVDNLNQQ